MAPTEKKPPIARFIQLIWPDTNEGVSEQEVFRIPVYLRKDGVAIKLGYLFKKADFHSLFIVREILISRNLNTVSIVASPVVLGDGDNAKIKKEVTIINACDVLLVKGKMLSLEIAQDGMEKVSKSIDMYPYHIQKAIRKHQLSLQLRSSVQRFLAGFAIAKSSSVCCIDWRHDPSLLGIERDTGYSLEYRLEHFAGGVKSHIDLLLGDRWDVIKVGGGFRVIVTLEIEVDVNQQLRLKTHATYCEGELDSMYRSKCMENFAKTVTPTPNFLLYTKHCSCGRLENASEKFESIHSQRGGSVSLDWEEFQNSKDDLPIEVSLEPELVAEPKQSSLNFEPSCYGDVEKELHDLEDPLTDIKKLLDTPSKGFSQLVFSVSNKNSEETSEKESLLFLSNGEINNDESCLPQKKLHDIEMEDYEDHMELGVNSLPDSTLSSPELVKKNLSLSLKTSTPEKDTSFNDNDDFGKCSSKDTDNNSENYEMDSKNATIENISDLSYDTADNKDFDASVRILEPHSYGSSNMCSHETGLLTSPEEDVCSEDYRVSSSNDCKESDDKISMSPQLTSSKVSAYVKSLPNPLVKESSPMQQEHNSPSPLNISIDDDADISLSSSKSKASRQSDMSNLTGRLNSGILYGSLVPALGGGLTGTGQATICPFPDDWQFNSIPESIENDDDID